MARSKAEEILGANKEASRRLVRQVGDVRARKILAEAQRQLEARLRAMRAGTGTFSETQAQATLGQVKNVLSDLTPKIRKTIVRGAEEGAELAGDGLVRYLNAAEEQFAGAGSSLALDEAAVMDAAAVGARASVLRRLASAGTPARGAEATPHRAKRGILERYGLSVVEKFEETIQAGLVAKSSFADMRARIIDQSPFLQGAPAHWAERIVRTEVMGGLNRASWEANREADDQLGDVCKILAATFDDRTAADSFAVHGQIRRPEEAFDTWFGPMQHPPSRPNDREVVVTHRVSWPIPPFLLPRDPSQVMARWVAEGRKTRMPPIPNRSSIDIRLFGVARPPRDDGEARSVREAFGPGDDDV